MREFLASMYEEHLEEASFLYCQRLALQGDADKSWLDVQDVEDRLEAHIDALVVGAESAVEICRVRACEGDPGELFAAVSVFCRQGQASLLAETFKHLDYDAVERVRAITDALKYDLPAMWRNHMLHALGRPGVNLTPILATVIGYQRVPTDGVLHRLLVRKPNTASSTLLWAIGRTGEEGAFQRVVDFLDADDQTVRSAAMYAALRLHGIAILQHLYSLARAGRCSPIALGLAGGRAATQILLPMLHQPLGDIEVVIALGLLGDWSAVGSLVQLLRVEELAGAAAEALYVISGAELYENVYVPEEITEEELLDKELSSYRDTGELPRRADGKPFGTSTHRLSRNVTAWEAWLKSHSHRFNPERRYRAGLSCTPEALIKCLASEVFPKRYRNLISDELLVRYRIDLALEMDMPVTQQKQLLEARASTFTQSPSRFQAGLWYLAGQVLPASF